MKVGRSELSEVGGLPCNWTNNRDAQHVLPNMQKNAICRDALFVLSLHSEYVANKIVMMFEGMARLMHEELDC